jgi:quaternary ammonium compound-resistance protein SugE
MSTAWIALLLAGIAEIGWPIGLKMSQNPGQVWPGAILSVVSFAVSGGLLWFAQKKIPIGTAYAVWTGIGAAGTFLVGVLVYHDSMHVTRFIAISFIIAGVVLLKAGH